MKKISEIKQGDGGVLVALVVNSSKSVTKTGNDYLNLEVSDETGVIKAKFWNATDKVVIESGSVYEFQYVAKEYRGSLQLDFSGYRLSDLSAENFCLKSKFDIDVMFSDVKKLINTVSDEQCKKLLSNLVLSQESKFKNHSGAKSAHHAFVGGLLQHTLTVTTSALKLASVYPEADKDVIVTAGLLHDIGKMSELSEFPSVDYTMEGVALGHISLGLMKTYAEMEKLGSFNEQKRIKILNCLASHHGCLEWGSPVVPCCTEAYIVHVSDLLDARIEVIREQTENLEKGQMSPYCSLAGTRFITP